MVEDEFDLVIVDDKSREVDIEARAAALGIRTLEWEGEAKGVTHAWNFAWQYFHRHAQYEHIVICNNDLLVPNGTITKLSRALDGSWAWVNPVTAHRGSFFPKVRGRTIESSAMSCNIKY